MINIKTAAINKWNVLYAPNTSNIWPPKNNWHQWDRKLLWQSALLRQRQFLMGKEN